MTEIGFPLPPIRREGHLVALDDLPRLFERWPIDHGMLDAAVAILMGHGLSRRRAIIAAQEVYHAMRQRESV